MVGGGGRSPFSGYFRVSVTHGAATLSVAGRLRPGASPVMGWAAAEEARDALATVQGDDRFSLLTAAFAALAPLDQGDLCVLAAASDPDGTAVSACGLAAVLVDGAELVPEGHPLLGEPGMPERVGFFHSAPPGAVLVAVPWGVPVPKGEALLACGERP